MNEELFEPLVGLAVSLRPEKTDVKNGPPRPVFQTIIIKKNYYLVYVI